MPLPLRAIGHDPHEDKGLGQASLYSVRHFQEECTGHYTRRLQSHRTSGGPTPSTWLKRISSQGPDASR